ncbi:hypothetical protein [Actinospica robiniae]|uniref:hypothetical protein n=1 Tax=Actinospica robiniae TaxID=304901 RepID=UPI00041C71EC|nr:hypothetical protein [Actinospica robiniae]
MTSVVGEIDTKDQAGREDDADSLLGSELRQMPEDISPLELRPNRLSRMFVR